ncbi:hypothetical protein JCM33374_g4842 [Metschnikowia sp. JCM 33374]|nr:hypothetical protein JCM33374_g4842 [Metschnikowia sp. JCM 33374]
MSRFPHPKLVSFDLWGTLFTPRAPIAQQYYDISSGHYGIAKSVHSIEADFPAVFAQMESEYPNYGKYSTDIKSCDEWWSELIVRLYGMSRDDAMAKRLCEHLISHFSSKEAYVLYDDVIPVLEKLQAKNVRLIGATNSDYRVFSILESLGVAQYFPRTSVFLSYDLGVAKPNRDFFRTIAKQYYTQDSNAGDLSTMTEFLENTWHVGDHYEKDFVGAVKSGWNGVLLDRKKRSIFLRHAPQKDALSNDCFEGPSPDTLDSPDMVMISNNRACVSELSGLLKLFGYE